MDDGHLPALFVGPRSEAALVQPQQEPFGVSRRVYIVSTDLRTGVRNCPPGAGWDAQTRIDQVQSEETHLHCVRGGRGGSPERARAKQNAQRERFGFP